ncbi:hypothetical protein [Nostoc sp.]|uniref:hypothetical protein n=1 Tax=Nostoc sp. TaxID=1180 RepID=UPI002FF54B35
MPKRIKESSIAVLPYRQVIRAIAGNLHQQSEIKAHRASQKLNSSSILQSSEKPNIKFGQSFIEFGQSFIEFGRSFIEFGQSFIEFGRSFVEFGRSFIEFGQSFIEFGQSFIEFG